MSGATELKQQSRTQTKAACTAACTQNIKQNTTRQALSPDRNNNRGRVAGKVETCQVDKLVNFDRQLMKTLFNLRALLGGDRH